MKQMIKFSLAACVAALSTGFSHAQTPPLASAGTRVMAVARAERLSGEIVMADQAGPLFDQAIGLADRQSGRSHRVGARWLWASVTKQVTAVLVMQQVESRALSLDATVRDYLPEFPGDSGDRLTIRQLLQHLSGLPNPNDAAPGVNNIPGFYSDSGAMISDGARSSGYCAGAPKAAPGSGVSYNNCDYLVLGAILERVSGKSYAVLVTNRIARPLGLHSLKLAPDGAARGGGVAIGYTTDGKRYPAINVATFGAAGALTGTARDLIALDRALLAGKLLQPQSRAVLWQGDPKLGYEALGVWSFPARLAGCAEPVALVERRGDVGGIQVRNVIAPELGRAIAVFTNDDTVDFGEVWQGKGLSYELLSAALCQPGKP